MQRPILTVTSHDEGRNAQVTLWPDRIERVKAKKMTSLGRSAQDTEVTPIKAVSSVQAQKDGMRFTKVTVYASGNTIQFRLGHQEAQHFKNAVMNLVLNGPPTAQPMQQQQPVQATPQPQGWHPDPAGRHEFRFWDGTRWTDLVADKGQQSEDPLAPKQEAHASADPASPASAEPGPEEQLRRLASMRDAGLITTDDFETKKAQILDRM